MSETMSETKYVVDTNKERHYRIEDCSNECRASFNFFTSSFFSKRNMGIEEMFSLALWRGVIGEFLACMLFLLCVVYVATYQQPSRIEVAITIGVTAAVLAQVFGNISGGHFNTAVSFGLFIAGRCSLIRFLWYALAQIIGSIAGVAIVWGTYPRGAEAFYVLRPTEGFDSGSAFLLETMFTVLLVLQVLACTDSRRPVDQANVSLSIGLTIMCAHFLLVPLTGCGINPSRAIGSSVVANQHEYLWIFVTAPFLGALIAAPLYELILAHPPTSPDKA